MALVRGVGSLVPCTRCLVSKEDLWDTSVSSTLRTSKGMQEILDKANQEKVQKDREEILKSFGLRNVQVFSNYINRVPLLN